MKVNKTTFLLSILLFFATLFSTGRSTEAIKPDGSDYTPSITIIKERPSGQVDANGNQIYSRIPNVSFTIKRIDVVPSKKDQKIDLRDPKTFIIKDYTGKKPVNITETTDVNGEIYVEGVDNLPKGFYQVIENSQYGQTALIVLPYLDKDDKLQDDIILYPKEHNPEVPITPVPETEDPEIPEEPDEDKKTPPTHKDKPGEPNIPNTDNPIDKIIQTSGELMTIPLIRLAVFIIGSFVVLVSLIFIISKRRKDNN